MGDIGIDTWCSRMEEHTKRGHHLIKYPEMDAIKPADDKLVRNIEESLFLKDQRVAFWQNNHILLTIKEMKWLESGV